MVAVGNLRFFVNTRGDSVCVCGVWCALCVVPASAPSETEGGLLFGVRNGGGGGGGKGNVHGARCSFLVVGKDLPINIVLLVIVFCWSCGTGFK